VHCDNVPGERLSEVLMAGWKLASTQATRSGLRFEDIRAAQAALPDVDLSPIRPAFAELVHRIRHAGVSVSDRRAVKLQRVMAASALLCGRTTARLSDLWVVRHIWDTEEQREVLTSLVDQAISREPASSEDHHRARAGDGPDAEALARDLEAITSQLKKNPLPDVERAYLKDRLGVLEGRCQWVKDATKREWLLKEVATSWSVLKPH